MMTEIYRQNCVARSFCGRASLVIVAIIVFAVVASSVVALVLSNLLEKPKDLNEIEQVAVRAAKSASRIVVETPECGFVSLADSEGGSATTAGDGYPLTIRGINTVFATVRLDSIIADKLGQPLMEQLAEKDMESAMTANKILIDTIENALKPDGSGKDKDGRPVLPYAEAQEVYQRLKRPKAASASPPLRLCLSLGSLEDGTATSVPIPQPQDMAAVPMDCQINGYYRSYVNVPYKETGFVFGGIGKTAQVVDHRKWRKTISNLPYQIPTIIKAELLPINKENSAQAIAVACAQSASVSEISVSPCALSISFPDGPVPEIKTPYDCIQNAQMNNQSDAPMDLLTAKNGDYPIDPRSNMRPLKWPITGRNIESVSNVWRLALYDWIRKGGPKVNIASTLAMQSITLDAPDPAKIDWKAPLVYGGSFVTIGRIPAGIIHIFRFDKDGMIIYKSKLLEPYPISVASENQLYGEAFSVITNSKAGVQIILIPASTRQTATLRGAWDIYIRDQVRNLGTGSGGKHAGEPLAMPALASLTSGPYIARSPSRHCSQRSDLLASREADQPDSLERIVFTPVVDGPSQGMLDQRKGYGQGKGIGLLGLNGRDDIGYAPFIAPQSDFAELMNPPAPFVTPMPTDFPQRPFNTASGTAVDIKFRRQVDVSQMNGFFSSGYLGIVSPKS